MPSLGKFRVKFRGQIPGTPYLIIDKQHQCCFYLAMIGIARAVAPGYPHHITQHGNQRQQTFFCDQDDTAYIQFQQLPFSISSIKRFNSAFRIQRPLYIPCYVSRFFDNLPV